MLAQVVIVREAIRKQDQALRVILNASEIETGEYCMPVL
jgi:hypothetical protein